jgi:hypothetical protein
MDTKATEKILYLLQYLDWCINNLVYNVLDDSEEDPHYSAVTATNLIKCFIDTMETFEQPINFHNVEEYLAYQSFTPEEIALFEQKRSSESACYIGKQY